MNECKCNLPKKALKCETKCGLTIVIIPAQLGDSTGVYAPKIGDYKNTLVKYEADTKVFLYDKDGNWTLVGTSVVPGVTLDTALSLASTNGVQNKVITKAINDANDSISGVNTALADETYDRATADGTLQNNIDAEALTRHNADGTLQGNIDAEALARQGADGALQGNIDAEVLARTNAISGVETKINRDVLADLVMSADANNVVFTEQKVNPNTGATSAEQDIIPAASFTTAGTVSAAEYQAIKDSQSRLDALENGSVAISGISAHPSQQDLTDAWLLATGSTELINRASIFDVDNSLIWTYYTNTSEWYSAISSVTFNPFTNSAAGSIKGSTIAGNVSANADGTGTVSGWASLVSTVSGKADSSSLSTVATSGDYDDLTNKPTIPTVNNATLTIQKNGTNVTTFTANASTDATANISVPTQFSDLSGTVSSAQIATGVVPIITMQTTDPGEGVALAANNFIAVYSA